MTTRIYVPRDSSALSLGAESVAMVIASEAARRKADVALVRNGSRGLYWLEPMVEVETAKGRIAYGPVTAKEVASLFEAGFVQGKSHALCRDGGGAGRRGGATGRMPALPRRPRAGWSRPAALDLHV